jgi:hypothetical protein
MARAPLMLTLLLIASSAHSQQSIEAITIPCSGAPSAAVVKVPQLISKWAAVRCTEYGHIVMAAPGWIWHAPRENQFVRLWAQGDGQDLKRVGHSAHFVQIDARRLSSAAAEEANTLLSASIGAPPQPLSKALELRVKANGGVNRTVVFVISEANAQIGNLWAYACGQTCGERTVFMIFRPQ